MHAQVIGISGSPVAQSNTDRVVQAVLESTGLETEFIKLASCTVQPCRACLGCAKDNICKVNDDFQVIAEKLKHARAFVIGGYPPYGTLDAFTKAFLERLFSMRHRNALNAGKVAVTVVTGNGRGARGIDEASDQIKLALSHEKVEVLGQIKVIGNVKCANCGFGEQCPMSAFSRLFDGDAEALHAGYCKAEEQNDVWPHAQTLGKEIALRIREMN